MSNSRSLFDKNFLLASLSAFFYFGSIFLVLPVLPLYVLSIGGKEADVGWVVGSAAIAALLVRPFIGREVDRKGRKNWILLGTLLMLAGSFLYFFAADEKILILLRVLIGAAVGIYTTAAAAYVSDLAPDHRRGEAFGYYGASINLAMAFGPLAGILLLKLDGSYRLLFAGTLLMALLAMILSLMCEEKTSPYPSAEPQLFNFKVLIPSLLAFANLASYGAIITLLPLYGQGRGMGDPGWFFVVYALTLVFTRALFGKSSDRWGRWPIIVAGGGLIALALTGLAYVDGSLGFLAIALLYGLGIGITMPALQAFAVDLVEPQERGTAMGTYTSIFDIGLAAGAILMVYLLPVISYKGIFISCAALVLASLLLYFSGAPKRKPVI